jgi:hypothetical protein
MTLSTERGALHVRAFVETMSALAFTRQHDRRVDCERLGRIAMSRWYHWSL